MIEPRCALHLPSIRIHYETQKHLREQEHGFTLVELLVVIVIIGLLAAIAIPIFMNQRQRANDATLTSDLRNVALAYETWHGSRIGGNDNYPSPNSTLVIYHPTVDLDNTSVRWNEQAELPEVNVSLGTRVEVKVIKPSDGTWTRPYQEGEFCLVGANPSSSYDYEQGAGSPEDFDKNMYYDVKLGGIVPFDEMVAAWQAYEDEGKDPKESLSCYRYVERYLGVDT